MRGSPGSGPPCAVEGCAGKHRGHGLCDKHLQRQRKYGDPLTVHTYKFQPGNTYGVLAGEATRFRPGRAPEEHAMWAGDDVGYHGVHQRLRKERGRADEHLCLCGCGKRAKDWAFDEPTGYSTDLSRYSPMSASCHKLMDLGHG